MTKTNQPRVTYDEAVTRIRVLLRRHPGAHFLSNHLARAIWPGHRMKPQGAAFAAGRFINRMEKEGILVWCWDGELSSRGYRAGAKA